MIIPSMALRILSTMHGRFKFKILSKKIRSGRPTPEMDLGSGENLAKASCFAWLMVEAATDFTNRTKLASLTSTVLELKVKFVENKLHKNVLVLCILK